MDSRIQHSYESGSMNDSASSSKEKIKNSPEKSYSKTVKVYFFRQKNASILSGGYFGHTALYDGFSYISFGSPLEYCLLNRYVCHLEDEVKITRNTKMQRQYANPEAAVKHILEIDLEAFARLYRVKKEELEVDEIELPIELEEKEAKELRSKIENHIERNDYNLVTNNCATILKIYLNELYKSKKMDLLTGWVLTPRHLLGNIDKTKKEKRKLSLIDEKNLIKTNIPTYFLFKKSENLPIFYPADKWKSLSILIPILTTLVGAIIAPPIGFFAGLGLGLISSYYIHGKIKAYEFKKHINYKEYQSQKMAIVHDSSSSFVGLKKAPIIEKISVWKQTWNETFDRRYADGSKRSIWQYFWGFPELLPRGASKKRIFLQFLLWPLAFVLAITLVTPVLKLIRGIPEGTFKFIELYFKKVGENITQDTHKIGFGWGVLKYSCIFISGASGIASSLIRYVLLLNPIQSLKECGGESARPAKFFSSVFGLIGQWMGNEEKGKSWGNNFGRGVGSLIGGILSLVGIVMTIAICVPGMAATVVGSMATGANAASVTSTAASTFNTVQGAIGLTAAQSMISSTLSIATSITTTAVTIPSVTAAVYTGVATGTQVIEGSAQYLSASTTVIMKKVSVSPPNPPIFKESKNIPQVTKQHEVSQENVTSPLITDGFRSTLTVRGSSS